MKKGLRIFASAASLLALAVAAGANSSVPPWNVPSMADWEQALLQNLTGANGVPVALGAPPASSGSCVISGQASGQSVGTFTASGACSAGTVIFTFLSPAPAGFECGAKDITTTADTLLETAYTTTTVTFTGTMASGDHILFSCYVF